MFVSPLGDALIECRAYEYALLIFVSKHVINIYKIPFVQMALLSQTTQTSEIFCHPAITPSEGDRRSPQDQAQKTPTLGAAKS